MRYVIVGLGLLVAVGALAGTKAAQISTLMAFGKQARELGPPPESVGVAVAETQRWEQRLRAVGSVATSQGVELRSETSGVVTRIHFSSGQRVNKGQVLVDLDTKVERAQLEAAQATRERTQLEAGRSQTLQKVGAVSPADRDAAVAAADVAAAEVRALQALIAKKTLRAPFAGRLGIKGINLGQLLSPGDPITVLESTHEVFVDFTVPQPQVGEVAAGMPVKIGLDTGRQIAGTLAAVEPIVDQTTRATRLRALVENPEEHLRPGMFVEVAVILPEEEDLVVVPATAVVHAPYGDSIFVVADKPADEPGMRETPQGQPVKVAQQRFVRTGERRGDFITVEEGVVTGETVVSAGAFKLRNGAPVVITKQGVIEPELEPELQNR